ncbi:MFS transporter [Kosakonia sp. SMBL-WEM22]|uniref:MFS transporter n=1 Tax=Kosakonia sp. SMBL-WEM22 TaxID=2725560 RepID=UPI001659D995|nr:MFS transporter [Kosakonia sp. SMBL-WEM22]QNQ20045.1 MFS transporter [Kosakonia sp. SMBL-WEM22]
MRNKVSVEAGITQDAGSGDALVLKPGIVFLFSLISALSVANVYASQPLLDAIALTLHVPQGVIGSVVTATQAGYALGLIFLVPLGDGINRKTLTITLLSLSAAALLAAGLAASFVTLLCALFFTGLLAVVVQLVVAWAAMLAAPEQRGKIVGTVTSGIVLGILLSRVVSGSLADIAGWRAVYLTSACFMLLMACLVATAAPAPAPSIEKRAASYPALLRSVFRLFVTEPQLRRSGAFALLIFTAFSILWSAMVLPLTALSLSHTGIGMFGLVGVAGALAAAKAGAWADRGWGRRACGISLVMLTLSWLPIAATEVSLLWLVVGIIMLDFAVQTVHVINQSTLIAARPEAASRLVGAYMCFYSTGSATGAIVATQLYAHFGWSTVCIAGAGVSACAFLLWCVKR